MKYLLRVHFVMYKISLKIVYKILLLGFLCFVDIGKATNGCGNIRGIQEREEMKKGGKEERNQGKIVVKINQNLGRL